MPSERFLKLSEEKQKRIVEAAVNEFARVPFESVSINQIIREADISREASIPISKTSGTFWAMFSSATGN